MSTSLLSDEREFYQTLVSRNYGFISKDLQQKIKTCRLLFLGCGLASLIAESAVRMGFERIVLVDHDNVELSNLNRQNYTTQDLSQSKVSCLHKKLIDINPYLKAKAITEEVQSKASPEKWLSEADIIINTIDYGKNYFDLVEYGRQQKKLVVCPFNPCDSGMAVFFNQDSQTIYQFLETDEPLEGTEFPRRLRDLYVPSILPEKLKIQFLRLLPEIKEKAYYPQLIIGAHITAAIVLQYITRYLNQEKIPLAPAIIYRELS